MLKTVSAGFKCLMLPNSVLQTIYNAITNGTPCVIVEGSGRVADVIAQVANLPIPQISISLIQKKLSIFFRDSYEYFTESKIMEWTKKVRQTVTCYCYLSRDVPFANLLLVLAVAHISTSPNKVENYFPVG